jgi:hypothetical protein
MQRKRLLAMAVLMALAGLSAAHAQTASPAVAPPAPSAAAPAPAGGSPGVLKAVLDNPRVHVVEATFKPGGKTGEMILSDHMLYMLTDGALVFKMVGKTPYEMSLAAGQAIWFPAQKGGLENASDKTVRALIVEVKSTKTAKTASPARPARSRGRRKR